MLICICVLGVRGSEGYLLSLQKVHDVFVRLRVIREGVPERVGRRNVATFASANQVFRVSELEQLDIPLAEEREVSLIFEGHKGGPPRIRKLTVDFASPMFRLESGVAVAMIQRVYGVEGVQMKILLRGFTVSSFACIFSRGDSVELTTVELGRWGTGVPVGLIDTRFALPLGRKAVSSAKVSLEPNQRNFLMIQVSFEAKDIAYQLPSVHRYAEFAFCMPVAARIGFELVENTLHVFEVTPSRLRALFPPDFLRFSNRNRGEL